MAKMKVLYTEKKVQALQLMRKFYLLKRKQYN